MPVYPMDIAGLHRELPICKVTDDLYIGAFICFGDAELTVACARDMLAMLEADSYDYLFTAEAKSIPLIHEMARQSGAKKYFIARKGPKAYMPDPLHVEDKSITTAGVQKLYLGRDDADLIRGKRIVLMDDVISTGGSLHAMEELVKLAGGTVVGRVAVLAEGDAGLLTFQGTRFLDFQRQGAAQHTTEPAQEDAPQSRERRSWDPEF